MTPSIASVRVLHVEDNPADCAFVQRCLEDYGHPRIDVTHVTRLSEALSAIKGQAFPLIIADLNLPDTDGLGTFLTLKEASPDSAFVVMTGLDDKDAGMQAVRSGAQDYLVKGDSGPQRIWQSVRNAMVRQGILRDMSSSAKELGEVNSRLQELTRVDPLTGLYNRRGFDECLARDSPVERREALGNTVLLIDIDDFKQVNDRLGHDQGDLALLEVSRRLRARLRPGDIAARVGGDEFMVLLPATPPDAASEVAERMRQSVEKYPVPSASGAFPVTVSVGVARQTPDANTAHALLARTHQSLTLSKQLGKNRVTFEDTNPGLFPRDAGGEARLLKRPFFRIADGEITGYEFLCRSWPANEAPSPRTGPKNPAALDRALRGFHHCVQAAAQLPAGLECHVRLHYGDLMGLDPRALLGLLPKSLEASLLRLEIKDLAHGTLPLPALAVLQALRAAGVRPVLHDADLRQHTVAALLQLEPDWVKIGRTWSNGIAADPFKERALCRLLKVVEGLGARAMACGVGDNADLDVLRRLNVFHGQGPLWSGHP